MALTLGFNLVQMHVCIFIYISLMVPSAQYGLS